MSKTTASARALQVYAPDNTHVYTHVWRRVHTYAYPHVYTNELSRNGRSFCVCFFRLVSFTSPGRFTTVRTDRLPATSPRLRWLERSTHMPTYKYGRCSYGLCSYGLYDYGLYDCGLRRLERSMHMLTYSCGLYTYGLYSHGLCSHGLCSYGLRCHTCPYTRRACTPKNRHLTHTSVAGAAGRCIGRNDKGHNYMGHKCIGPMYRPACIHRRAYMHALVHAHVHLHVDTHADTTCSDMSIHMSVHMSTHMSLRMPIHMVMRADLDPPGKIFIDI